MNYKKFAEKWVSENVPVSEVRGSVVRNDVLQLVETLVNQNHSGASWQMVVSAFNALNAAYALPSKDKLRAKLMNLFVCSPLTVYPPSLLMELDKVRREVGLSGGVINDIAESWMEDLSEIELQTYIEKMASGGYK